MTGMAPLSPAGPPGQEEWLATVLPPGAYERNEDIGSGEAGPHDGPGEDETFLEWT
jgi:hypothetical protein